jgi:outer membrane protein OmpA-like peptidoglycan-associated protein
VKNRRRNSVISSTQKVGQVTLTWTGERISDHQLQTAVKMGDRYTWIAQRLQFDWVTETVAEQEEIGTPGQQLPGNWQAERRRLDKLAQSNLSSVDDMKNVANAIRALVAEGRVKRLIIRGYADRVETKKQDPVALSQRRAEFVRDQLVKRYRIDFTGIDVFTIGCGTWYAPADEHKPSRAVEVEPELGDPPEEAAFEQIVPAWIFHTYHGPKPGNGEVGEIFELEYFKESGGNVYRDRARSAAEVVLEQQRALSYIDAFEEISNEAAAVSGATGQGALLEQMRDAVRDWTWTPPGLPSLKSKRVKISEGKYKSVDSVPEALKIVQPDGSIKLTPLRPQLIRELKEVSHTVENLWSIPLSGHMDDQVQRRLHANIESPPNIDASGLTVGFKSSMPVPP